MNKAPKTLIQFLRFLEDNSVYYYLDHVRDGAVMVIVVIPGQRWEVEFFEDDTVEVEVFKSDGTIYRSDFFDKHLPGLMEKPVRKRKKKKSVSKRWRR